MALGLHHQARTAVAAAVFKCGQAAIGLAHHHDFLGAHVGQDVVAGRGQFALVAHIHPGALKNALLLQGKQRRVGVDAAMHPVGLHPFVSIPLFEAVEEVLGRHVHSRWPAALIVCKCMERMLVCARVICQFRLT